MGLNWWGRLSVTEITLEVLKVRNEVGAVFYDGLFDREIPLVSGPEMGTRLSRQRRLVE